MEKWNRIFVVAALAAGLAGSAIAQDLGVIDSGAIRDQIKAAQKAMKSLDMDQVRKGIEAAQSVDMTQVQKSIEAAQKAMQHIDMNQLEDSMRIAQQAVQSVDMDQVQDSVRTAQRVMESAKVQQALQSLQDRQPQLDRAFAMLQNGALSDLGSLPQLGPMLAFQSDAAERAREQRERQQEQRDRQREAVERTRETEDRKIELYRDGTGNIDEGKYERAIASFNRLLDADSKWSRTDGVYYWKAYALNKLGKRDEAMSTVGEIQKQFPQSKWIGEAKALQVEIQQASGRPVSPESLDDQDLKLLALTSLINSDPERALPLVDKVLNDPKNNVAIKAKALYVLATQARTDKAREIVSTYAKNGSNPDLQLRAIAYVGAFRSKEALQTLADIYSGSSDVAVKRAVLRSMANSRDNAHLGALARSESNPDLRREAIRGLGNMRATAELAQLYSTETTSDLKESILLSLMNARADDKLVEIAKSEKTPEVRAFAIRYLGNMRSEKAADGLAGMYSSETDKNVKEQIIRSLGQEGAGKQLVEAIRNEKDAELKTEGVRWLGRMRGSKEASDYLTEIINK